MSLPSAVHVFSLIKCEASGDWEARYSVVFYIGSFAKYVYICIIFVVLVVVCILFCAEEKKRRSRDESRHCEKGRTDEISVLSLLSSYLR